MDLYNSTPFQVAWINGRYFFPGHSLTIIAKATFSLFPSEALQIDEEQIYPTGDEFYPEDKEMIGGPKYPSDFAYFKPKTDLLLVGKCYSPGNKKISSINVKFQAGS